MNSISDKIKKFKISKLKSRALIAAMSLSTISFGAGRGENNGSERDQQIKFDITTVESRPNLLSESIVENNTKEIDMAIVADTIVAINQNTVENFDISNHKFTADELSMIEPCDLGEKIKSVAYKTAKKNKPQEGEQTYCLRRVKQILANNGINLEADRFAYRAIEGLQNSSEFIEIKCDLKDFSNLPEGAVMVFDKGKAPYGHIGIVSNGKDCSDYAYGIRTTRGSFGKAHAFVLKSSKFAPELTQKLCQEGALKEEVKEFAVSKVQDTADNFGKPMPNFVDYYNQKHRI